jgi:hypothetical protein
VGTLAMSGGIVNVYVVGKLLAINVVTILAMIALRPPDERAQLA